MFRTLVFSISLACAASPANADWHGVFAMKSISRTGQSNVSRGRIFASEDVQRFNFETPQTFSQIIDTKHRKSWNIDHKQMTATELFMGDDPSLVSCKSLSAHKCLKKRGFKPVGRGHANGYACNVYERLAGDSGTPTHFKICQPRGFKEVAVTRTAITMPDGAKSIINVTNITFGRQPASLFQPPKNYKKITRAPRAPAAKKR